MTSPVHIGHIALATALDWLEFRALPGFRENRPRLVEWFNAFEARPSMLATLLSGETRDEPATDRHQSPVGTCWSPVLSPATMGKATARTIPLPIIRIARPIILAAIAVLAACTNQPAPIALAHSPAAVHADVASPRNASVRFELENTEVRDIQSKALGRTYQLFVSLPRDYQASASHRYPVLFITDTTYAFPMVRSIARMVGDRGSGLEDFILVGLSYAKDDTSQYSRRRDYTPTPDGPRSATTSDMPERPVLHGEAEAYRRFIRDEVFPVVAGNYRADMGRRIFAGHSYGALLGAHILLTEPAMFQKYILSSASLWYDQGVMFQREHDYASEHDDLQAEVFMSIGAFETVKPGSGDRRYNTEEDMLGDMQRFETQLRSRGYPGLRVESTVIDDEDHLSVYPAAITRGLKWALPPMKRG